MKKLSCFVFLFVLVNRSLGLTIDGVLLLSFKYSVLNDPLRVFDSWNYFDETPCSWYGVTCGNPAMSVTALSLPNSQILGSIPEDMGRIPFLQTIDLSNNSINGSIPFTLLSSSEIQFLDLSNNLISGEIPELVSGLTSLRVLNLSDNALAGEIPKNITSLGNLTVLNLKNNYLSGDLPTGFDSLEVVDLSSNLFNGTLTSDFGGHNISYFNISYNRLSGEIPPEFANEIPQNASLDLSFNNFTGEIPDSSVLIHQGVNSFSGNPNLCGKPLSNICNANFPSEKNVSAPTLPPAIAVIPKSIPSTIPSNPATNYSESTSNNSQHGLRKGTIIGIVVGDVAGILILVLIFVYIYKSNKMKKHQSALSACCVKRKSHDEESSEAASTDDEEEEQQPGRVKQSESGIIVTIDGEKELDLETLLKASAYILGASGSSIMYKAVLEDGRTLAVRRIGESGLERFRDFENQIRVISKLVHPNLVRVRGFYWGADEKLVIYDYIPNGSIVNARYRKVGSSPCPLPLEVRLKIAKGIAKGLQFIHEKKHVHANLKPSNVLLDFDMEPKIGDFGLQRLVTADYSSKANGSIRNFGSTRSTASRDSFQDNLSPNPSPLGTGSPYYAPESLRSLKPNPKWDVYSFGVLFLELLTGKVFSNGEEILTEDKSRVLRMADVAIRGDMEGREDALLALLKLGFNCISVLPQNRPTMKEIVQILDKFPSSYSNINHY